MFKEWGFLLGEIWVLLALAVLVGLIAGWLIWGGRRSDEAALAGLRADLERERARAKAAEEQLAVQAATPVVPTTGGADLRAQLDRCHDEHRAAEDRVEALEAQLLAYQEAQAAQVPAAPAAYEPAAPEPETTEPEAPSEAPDAPSAPGERPEGIAEARGGQADDLKLINGVGPKLERLCNSLGYWHFDQIAAWTDAEVAWVDDNLEGFKGRVTRDNWVAQARDLMKG